MACIAVASLMAGCGNSQEETLPEGPPLLPGGYQVVLDRDRPAPGHFVTAELPEGVRLTTGPAGIAWRPGDTISMGDFRAEAVLTLHGAPVAYRESYGIFVGGRGLEGSSASYLYLLVRPTGEYMLKRRIGETNEVIVDWLPHATVQGVVADGDEPVNTLAIEVRGGETRFLVNGVVVFVMPTDEARPYGVAGLRMNHRLDVTLGEWSLGPPPPSEPLTSGS